MSDPRMQEVADRAQSAARPAEFAELARRGRRRRTRGVLAAGAVTALVLGGTALGVHTAFDDSSAPANPVSPVPTSGQTSQSEHTTRVTPRQQLTAEQVVDDPHAALVGVAVATDDHDVRASEWSVCSDDACASRLWAVAVSADAFQHAAYALVAEPTALTWTGGDTFVVSTRDGTLSRIDSSGNSYPLAISEEVGPLSTDETLVIDGRDPATPYAVDAARLTAHPIPLPSDQLQITTLLQSGQTLWGLGAGTGSVLSSPDGGTTWRAPHLLPGSADGTLHDSVRSGDPQTLAVIDLGDSGFARARFHRSDDGGASWQDFDLSQLAGTSFAAWTVVEPSGELLVYLADGSTRPSPHGSPGLFESDSTEWLHFHHVDTSPPLQGAQSSLNDGGRLLAAVTDDQGRQTLFLSPAGYVGSQPVAALMSTDEGRTWTPTRYR